MLFKPFCSPIYGCQLWCSIIQYSVNKLRVAYYDALDSCCANHDGVVRLDFLHLIMFRHLLPALAHKQMYSFLSLLYKCNNYFIHAMMNSDIYFQSPPFKRWRSTLY